MLSIRQFASSRAANRDNAAYSWNVTDPIPEHIHADYAMYMAKVKSELERIAASPWGRSSGSFAWCVAGIELRIHSCGMYIRNSDGLYDYEGEEYVIVQTELFPTVITLQCISKPSPDNVATFHFGYNKSNTYNLERYEGPACAAASFQSLDDGNCSIQVSKKSTNYYGGVDNTSYVYPNDKVLVNILCPVCKCQHSKMHTSLRDKLVLTHTNGSVTFKFIDHRWVVVKLVAG